MTRPGTRESDSETVTPGPGESVADSASRIAAAALPPPRRRRRAAAAALPVIRVNLEQLELELTVLR